ncbi:MAG: phosphatidate cytidylyltransferase [Nitrospiraceae bacterium]|nr:phosphatidate cytidylyltransferase [Nitrospiraceae bacterium]
MHHIKRLIIALIILPLLFIYITKLPAIYFLFILMIVSALAQYEFYTMYGIKGLLRFTGILLGMLILYFIFIFQYSLDPQKPFVTDLAAIGFLIVAVIRLFYKRKPESSLRDIAPVVTGIAYIPGLLGFQVYLREQGFDWIILLYGCVWASDSMAYLLGSTIGKRKLYSEISPNKTIAGLFGSILGGAIGALIFKYALADMLVLSFINAVILGMVIGAVSVIGDLVESMFKRDAGVKDSSSLILEHGGMLDKLDSSLFAAPAVYWTAMALRLI